MSSSAHHPPHNKHQRLGGKLGPRIAAVTSQAMSDHLQRSAGYRADLAAAGALRFFATMTREKLQHIAPFTGLYLGHDDTPPELEKLLQFIHHGQGEASELLNMLGVGGAVSSSIASALGNYLAPANQDLIRQRPNSLISPDTAAAAMTAGVMGVSFAHDEANRAGINNERFEVLHRMSRQYPGVSQLLEMLRRGIITEGAAHGMLVLQRIPEEQVRELLALRREVLGPADAALAVLRGVIPDGEGSAIAAESGINNHDFEILVANTGEPPGLMQLLEAYRRGFIDKARLDKGIRQSRVRTEWTDVVEKLRFSPASTSDALRGVVQNHLSDAQGRAIAVENGLRPEDWDWLAQTEGNPPGVEQMLHLYNRGVMSKAQVEQGIRESRLKNKYVGPVQHLRIHMPEGRQITQMLSRGALSHKRALELLQDIGYEPDVAEALVHSALTDQVGREKNLAQGQIVELYHDHAIDRAAALKALETLGYHTHNAELLLHLTDLKRENTLRQAAIAPIRSAYVGHHISEQSASTDLDALGIAAGQRDYLLQLWTVERAAHRRSLTEAQVIAANVHKLFTDEVTLERLRNMGYTDQDARVLIDLEKGRTTFV